MLAHLHEHAARWTVLFSDIKQSMRSCFMPYGENMEQGMSS